MGNVLKNLVGTECWIFIDDVVYPTSAEEHALRLENVLTRFEEANLKLHHGKYAFAQSHVRYLGFVLSKRGVSSFPDKV